MDRRKRCSYKCVMENIENAALRDSRFDPVTEGELDGLDIEISILTVPEKLEFESGDDLKRKLMPLVDGVIIKKDGRQGTFLPQVWGDLPDKDDFLSNLCEKAGLDKDCWQDTSLEVSTYQALVFS